MAKRNEVNIVIMHVYDNQVKPFCEMLSVLHLVHVHMCCVPFRFEGGLMEHSVRLSEGFAAVLELCDLMSTTRERW